MTIDQVRAVLEQRVAFYGIADDYRAGKSKAYREALSLLELIDGERGQCPECGGRMGSRLPDGRWRCAGLSSYAVLASENCGCVYQDGEAK